MTFGSIGASPIAQQCNVLLVTSVSPLLVIGFMIKNNAILTKHKVFLSVTTTAWHKPVSKSLSYSYTRIEKKDVHFRETELLEKITPRTPRVVSLHLLAKKNVYATENV